MAANRHWLPETGQSHNGHNHRSVVPRWEQENGNALMTVAIPFIRLEQHHSRRDVHQRFPIIRPKLLNG
jgi:hypothetical protein